MALHQQLNDLAEQESAISVTLSFNTHRTHPDNRQDIIVLKNMVSDAKKSLLEEFDKRTAQPVIDKLDELSDKIDISHNLESIHVFINEKDATIIRSTWPLENNNVTIGNRFSIAPLLKMANRSYEYGIVLLTQAETKLYKAVDSQIVQEINNDDFPFKNNLQIRDAERKSDARNVDNKISEYFNHIDKALLELHNTSDMRYVLICLDENYSAFLQVADRSEIYLAYSPINNNEVSAHELALQAWKVVSQVQQQERVAEIDRLMKGISQGLVLTDIKEIYQASVDGNGELLIVHEDFQQAAKKIGDREIELLDEVDSSSFDYDIVSLMVWNVRSKGGRVIFTQQDQLKELGDIALLKRY